MGNLKKGLVFVVSAPAGTGKSTLVEMLLNDFPQNIVESRSCTTRKIRPSEITDIHYEFLTKEQFQTKIDQDEFLEYATVFGNLYGTSKTVVEKLQKEGKHVVLVIDTQGAKQVMQKIPVVSIFISPPSFEELRRRLLKRQTESEEMIEQRLKWAENEIKQIPHYDYHVINDDLNITYNILKSIFIAEEAKRRD